MTVIWRGAARTCQDLLSNCDSSLLLLRMLFLLESLHWNLPEILHCQRKWRPPSLLCLFFLGLPAFHHFPFNIYYTHLSIHNTFFRLRFGSWIMRRNEVCSDRRVFVTFSPFDFDHVYRIVTSDTYYNIYCILSLRNFVFDRWI